MPSSMKHSSRSIGRSRDMGYVSGQERSSVQQQNLDAVRERIPLPWIEKGSFFQDKHRVRHSFSQSYIDPNCELRKGASGEKVAQSKSSKNDQKPQPHGWACDDNELVKHMSNLPGFLLKVEKDNTIQEKALNFGVLDWKRLEKWKYTERMPGKLHKKTSSTGNSFSSASGPPKIGPNLCKQPSAHSRSLSLSCSGKQPMLHGLHFSSPQVQPPPPHSSHLNTSKEVRNRSYQKEEKYVPPPHISHLNSSKEVRNGSYQKEEKYVLPLHSSHLKSPKEERNCRYQKEEKYVEYIKSKGKATCIQEDQAAESIRIGRVQNHFQQRDKFYEQSCSGKHMCNSKMKDPQNEMMSERGASSLSSKQGKMMSERGASSLSSKQGKHNISFRSPKKINTQGKESEMRFDEVKLTSECCLTDPENIVLQVPKHFDERISSDSSQSTESRTSLDAQLSAATGDRLSDFFSPQQLFSGVLSADIPHSCPLLPSTAMEPHNLLTSQAVDLDICSSVDPATFISSETKCSVMNEETARPSILVEGSKRKQAHIAEQPTVKGRTPSPTRRFSFNLGRMSRSFSFKESSAVPQLSSTYTTVRSGPVRPEVALGMDNSERDQANASSRGRSSPLRRLLDPLLKHKTTADNVQPLNGSLRSATVSTTGNKGPSQDTKPVASTFQALLQLTFKNGLPFFKLVVENSKDMLAAAVKRLPTSATCDPCMIYSFYSVHEIKKKSMNWMNHGSKSKICSLGYNVIGQMKISNSYHLKVNTGNASECGTIECVLYGVDPTQVDRQMLEAVPNKEIAAIVVKNSSKEANDGELSDKIQLFEGMEFPQCVSAVTLESEGTKNSNGTVVILPGGVHGIPIKGAPSSLISRWRSGGSCDCGGWDVGCKVRILAESGKGGGVLQEAISSSTHHDNHYMQGGRRKSKPVFSLKSVSNELYSIELDASISLLEAFATSVAYVTCWKFPEMIDTKGLSRAEHSPTANTEADKRKTATFQGQIPAKYVTCPPLSPVGRI